MSAIDHRSRYGIDHRSRYGIDHRSRYAIATHPTPDNPQQLQGLYW
ncbi:MULTISPECIES: hypothetical protein [unclassified Moorena]|nr:MULTISPECIES: hypothetical protein [unclassified Moorena]NEQ08133.1 hypothetical protein [Moorena sp. SIO4E2]NES45963.1 hypothetical protein [Moorena sp. SIO2C4]